MQLSFEVFPPKKDSEFPQVYDVARELSRLGPDYISVTYGAGGSRSKRTVEIAAFLRSELNMQPIAHITCVGSTRKDIDALCEDLRANGIRNVLALRGDRPRDMTDEQYDAREFTYAGELLDYLHTHTHLQLWAACYPEKHFESFSRESDLRHMKEKQDLGASGFFTQMFFDNDFFYDFRDRAAQKGVTAPIHAGIMPITRVGQLGTSVSLSGSSVPKALADIIAAYGASPEELYKAGLDYAVRQIDDLMKNGVDGIHIYTMNKPAIAGQIAEAIGWKSAGKPPEKSLDETGEE